MTSYFQFYLFQHISLTLQLFWSAKISVYSLHVLAFFLFSLGMLCPSPKHFALFCFQATGTVPRAAHNTNLLRLNYAYNFISDSHRHIYYYSALEDAVTHNWNRKDEVHVLIPAIFSNTLLYAPCDYVTIHCWMTFLTLRVQKEERLFLITCRRLLQGKLIAAGFSLSDSFESHSCAALFLSKQKNKTLFLQYQV